MRWPDQSKPPGNQNDKPRLSQASQLPLDTFLVPCRWRLADDKPRSESPRTHALPPPGCRPAAAHQPLHNVSELNPEAIETLRGETKEVGRPLMNALQKYSGSNGSYKTKMEGRYFGPPSLVKQDRQTQNVNLKPN